MWGKVCKGAALRFVSCYLCCGGGNVNVLLTTNFCFKDDGISRGFYGGGG